MNDDDNSRTNGEVLENLIQALADALNQLPLPSMYNKEKRDTLEAFTEQAAFVGAYLCELGNGLQAIGVDPMAIAAAMEITGRSGRESVLNKIRKDKTPCATPDTAKPFVVYGNTTLN